jgi:RNA polymerase sigma-70 factor (ECF subfamily)
LYVLGRVSDVHLAEDVVSETFLAMVDAIDRVRADEEPAFAVWLLGIARHKVVDHYRRQGAMPAPQNTVAAWEEPVSQAEAGDPLDVVSARESWAEVTAALQRLTEEQRMVVLYRCVLGYETEEVSRLLGRQPGAVRALQFRALASLARFLAASGTKPAADTSRPDSNGRPWVGGDSRSGNDPRR